MKNFLRTMVLVLWASFSGCKTPEWTLKPYQTLRWNNADTQVLSAFVPEDHLKPKTDRMYTWFDKGVIGTTQGGYSGKLLHGTYTSWYLPAKQLKEKGHYEHGLKEGIWLLWAENGQLKAQQKWKNGLQVLPKAWRSPAQQGMKPALLKRLKRMLPFNKKKPDASGKTETRDSLKNQQP